MSVGIATILFSALAFTVRLKSSDADRTGGADNPLVKGQPLLFGTVNGMVGTILTLTEENYGFLDQLQTAMTKVVKGVGGFSHEEWRSFTNGRRTSPSSNFIDGDLVECFLDMPRSNQEEVLRHVDSPAGGQQWSVQDVVHRVEEMQRLH